MKCNNDNFNNGCLIGLGINYPSDVNEFELRYYTTQEKLYKIRWFRVCPRCGTEIDKQRLINEVQK